MRHTRPVELTRPDVPRSDFEQDLLYSLGSLLTVCRIQRSAAEREARQSFLTVRLCRADDIVNAIFRNYERLPEQIANEIPLERIWMLVRSDDEL